MEPTYKNHGLELLENSSHRLRQIELMRYELQHIPQISDSDHSTKTINLRSLFFFRTLSKI